MGTKNLIREAARIDAEFFHDEFPEETVIEGDWWTYAWGIRRGEIDCKDTEYNRTLYRDSLFTSFERLINKVI